MHRQKETPVQVHSIKISIIVYVIACTCTCILFAACVSCVLVQSCENSGESEAPTAGLALRLNELLKTNQGRALAPRPVQIRQALRGVRIMRVRVQSVKIVNMVSSRWSSSVCLKSSSQHIEVELQVVSSNTQSKSYGIIDQKLQTDHHGIEYHS